jgi:hypothetical protein
MTEDGLVREAVLMSVTRAEPAETRPETQTPAPWWRLPEIWGTMAITAMWLAVIFVGVYGGDMTFASQSNDTTVIPVGAVVAVCAAVATAAVSKHAFHQ